MQPICLIFHHSEQMFFAIVLEMHVEEFVLSLQLFNNEELLRE